MTESQQTIFMVFGGILAAAGLLLLFLRKEAHQNRIKLLGWEFEISTPALVVLLVGCGIFVFPFFIGPQLEKESVTRPEADHRKIADKPEIDTHKTIEKTPTSGEQSPEMANTQEVEPNEHISQATPITFGTTIRGRLKREDKDFYRFKVSKGFEGKVRIICRQIDSSNKEYSNIRVEVYDSVEKQVAWDDGLFGKGVTFAFFPKAESTYYVIVGWQISPIDRLDYEVVVRKEEE